MLEQIPLNQLCLVPPTCGYRKPFTDEILLNDDPKCIYHESLTLFAYLSGLTERIIFATGIMVLPKHQTILVARQAAEVDVLSNVLAGYFCKTLSGNSVDQLVLYPQQKQHTGDRGSSHHLQYILSIYSSRLASTYGDLVRLCAPDYFDRSIVEETAS